MDSQRIDSAALRVAMAAALFLSSNAVMANTPVAVAGPQQAPAAIDVSLQPGDVLIGQLVDANGQPDGKVQVKLTLTDGRSAVAKTNADGSFAFRGVKGVAQISTEDSLAVVRAWRPGVAPPNATPALLLVKGDAVARGQYYAGPGARGFVDRSKRLLANPLFLAGVIATAVAIPVAIANDDDDPAS